MASTTPAGLEIKPRHMDFELPDPLPRHWHGGDAFKSHLFDAMSVLFPDGERFFIDSVRNFREQIADPVLKEQIRGFIGQEGHHSREHLVYSQRLKDQGYDITRIEKLAQARIRYTQKKFSTRRQLAATAALEHITAIMANGLLTNPRTLEGAEPVMQRLWRWHALEETEHKAVAFDVYNQVCGSRRLLRRAMVMATFFFVLDTFRGLVHMLKRDGLLWNWRVWRDGLKWSWGKDGVFRPLLREYRDFFSKDFHPWQHNNLDLLYQVRKEYDPQPMAHAG
ncbi:putative metal-dependent hydrolase [Pseudomonas citronellolis]|uniref:metal-dependent hydrolase n=1 Tax=Pseudomonas citronellolis TaxID=53408 RepID=UPI00209CC87B|nr:metal-dependent hydrolase [Pseudomonas citronellolis]MCP1642276.1 putative metal-dependent hydrolase [Pseudomonas citronellolis]MCP1668201.1 putative metal-dependent hydrolase [Pseudomonas citronellolis]MCP1699563.1 putative metal-dependent hydrolase [Pseudomonas citronellolis]MCP1706178.1 putative metal-dependent hydrolase [Pseudomonas citronellolis]MCP1799201.1 putative metal-dependent hydrolase [Pseudomonas citronellolis]